MSIENQNNTLFIDTALRSVAAMIAAVATRNKNRQGLDSVGEKLASYLAEELVKREVPYRTGANMLGVSVRTFHRKLKDEQHEDLPTIASSILDFLIEKGGCKKLDLYRHFYTHSPEDIGAALRDLKLLGHVRLKSGALYGERNMTHGEALYSKFILFILYQYDALSFEELVKITPISGPKINEALTDLLVKNEVGLEGGKYHSIRSFRISESDVSQTEELLIFSLMTIVDANAKSVTKRLETKGRSDLTKGAVRCFRSKIGTLRYNALLKRLNENNEIMDEMWRGMEQSNETDDIYIITFNGHSIHSLNETGD